jgi:hypothetical protein
MSKLSIKEAEATVETLATPRASHVTPPPSPSDNETVVWDSDSDDEYLDADEWFKWFKTTDEYKQMNEVSEVTVLTGSNRF